MSLPIINLFCEGASGSYDKAILEKIADGISNEVLVLIVPTGGKRSIGGFIQGYNKSGLGTQSEFLAFRDRDFDYAVPDSCKLISTDKKYMFAGYRSTIENYLLAPERVWNYLEGKRLYHGSFQKLDDVTELFSSAAKKICHYSTVRHALGATRRPISLNSTWMDKSGTLPSDLSEDYCIEEAGRLISSFRSDSMAVSEHEFKKHYDIFKNKFDENFISRSEYLIYFHGKDLQSAIQLVLNEMGLNEFPFKSYYKAVLGEFNYLDFPDLIELSEKIRSLGQNSQ